MPKTAVRDTELHFEQTGDGEPALVFVHGMCGGGWVWQDQVTRLSDRFTCIAYDRRGHSRSPDESGDQSIVKHTEDLAALIEALGLDRPVVVGSSGGAVVTVELLHRHPNLVRGAVLSEPPLFNIDPAAEKELVGAVRGPLDEAVRRDGPQAVVEAFFSVVCPAVWPQLDEKRRQAYRENAPLLFATLEADSETVTLDDLRATEVPTCVVCGSKSQPPMRAISKRLADALPRGYLVEFERSGHGTYVEAPEEFAQTVIDFVGKLGPVQSPTSR